MVLQRDWDGLLVSCSPCSGLFIGMYNNSSYCKHQRTRPSHLIGVHSSIGRLKNMAW
ncbi:hypothetical protein PAXINDRAFT_102588 [Paxillus involutus ATCC 200175]|uniref:Uncharacterized protein n=1 Tax=Paxillus involutus ATCC 200175 TaxID=664439 RepID=A0A0C9SNS1_PAXIN|nr:hypothetical protein PAXINDRAFT_102588 [Paxillus involutus ATCC 200175]